MNKKSKILIVILVIILMGITLFVGYNAYNKFKDGDDVKEEEKKNYRDGNLKEEERTIFNTLLQDNVFLSTMAIIYSPLNENASSYNTNLINSDNNRFMYTMRWIQLMKDNAFMDTIRVKAINEEKEDYYCNFEEINKVSKELFDRMLFKTSLKRTTYPKGLLEQNPSITIDNYVLCTDVFDENIENTVIYKATNLTYDELNKRYTLRLEVISKDIENTTQYYDVNDIIDKIDIKYNINGTDNTFKDSILVSVVRVK